MYISDLASYYAKQEWVGYSHLDFSSYRGKRKLPCLVGCRVPTSRTIGAEAEKADEVPEEPMETELVEPEEKLVELKEKQV